MKLFFAVVVDLIEFLSQRIGIFSRRRVEINSQLLPPALPAAPQDGEVPMSPPPQNVPQHHTAQQQFGNKSDVRISDEASRVAFVCVRKARVMQSALWKIDTVIHELSYGATVRILDFEGRFVRIFYKDTVGWILKDEITEVKEEVLPQLVHGVTYLAADSETKKLREYIRDEFFTRELYAPLQGTEYVYYELLTRNQNITWPIQRPRLAGLWHGLLRGNPTIHSSVVPKTGSILEYRDGEGEGYLGLVTAVTPEETITVQGVGLHEEGTYSVSVLPKTDWQEYRPIFIQVR